MIYYLSRVKTNDAPKFNAYLLVCLLCGFNFFSICVIGLYFLKINPQEIDSHATKMVGGLSAICIIIYLYLHLYKKRDDIYSTHKRLSLKRKQQGKLLFWIYSLISIPLFFYLAVNLRWG